MLRLSIAVLTVALALGRICAAEEKRSDPEFAGWGEVVDPDGDCLLSVEQEKLKIAVPGKAHDFAAELRRWNAPRVLRDVKGDFIAEVLISGTFNPQKGSTIQGRKAYNGAGILLIDDNNNHASLQRASFWNGDRVRHYLNFEIRQAGKMAGEQFSMDIPDADCWLKLERRDGNLYARTSTDGVNWKSYDPLPIEMPANLKIGVEAVSSAPGPFECVFERFSIFQNGAAAQLPQERAESSDQLAKGQTDLGAGPPPEQYAANVACLCGGEEKKELSEIDKATQAAWLARTTVTKVREWSLTTAVLRLSTGELLAVEAKKAVYQVQTKPANPNRYELLAMVNPRSGHQWVGGADADQAYIETESGIVSCSSISGGLMRWHESALTQEKPHESLDELTSRFEQPKPNPKFLLGPQPMTDLGSYFNVFFFTSAPGSSQFAYPIVKRMRVDGGKLEMEFTSPTGEYHGEILVDLKSKAVLKAKEDGKETVLKDCAEIPN